MAGVLIARGAAVDYQDEVRQSLIMYDTYHQCGLEE